MDQIQLTASTAGLTPSEFFNSELRDLLLFFVGNYRAKQDAERRKYARLALLLAPHTKDGKPLNPEKLAPWLYKKKKLAAPQYTNDDLAAIWDRQIKEKYANNG